MIDDGESSTAFVVDEDGVRVPTEEFWLRKQAARIARFGTLSPKLAARRNGPPDDELGEVSIIAGIDLPQPTSPYAPTDKKVLTEDFECWSSAHTTAQTVRIQAQQSALRGFLRCNCIEVSADLDGVQVVLRAKHYLRAAVSPTGIVVYDMGGQPFPVDWPADNMLRPTTIPRPGPLPPR